MAGDDRRPPFRSAPFDRGRGARPSGSDHGGGDRQQGDRPPFNAPRPFTRPATRGGDLPAPPHSVRIRDGERELEVVGAPAFVRQILDDLPALLGRMRGEAAGRTAISMPAPPEPASPALGADTTAAPPAGPAVKESAALATDPAGEPLDPLQGEVFEVLRKSPRPLAVAAIRGQLGAEVSGQQVRRLLERAGSRVAVSAEKPATYSLR